MSRYVDKFSEEECLKVVKAYLVNGLSYRDIERDILGIPAPGNGGGYVAMDIIHSFNIDGKKKSILSKEDINKLINNSTGSYHDILIKIKSFIEEEKRAEKIIRGLNINNIDNTEITVKTKQRIGQDKLRKYILDIYNHKCALCDIDKDDLLICSHIIPWNGDEKNRLNPRNAICLCALHDKLFDKGYFSLDKDYKFKFSSKADNKIINLFKNLKFRKPFENSPDEELLKKHFDIYCV
ncbi:HNH endonuclease [Clostridium ihumii]|uniref:HNH endonuclease n=1 Tax=Clostridium ihumii TaxID=1470356 RepID=UPI003D33E389